MYTNSSIMRERMTLDSSSSAADPSEGTGTLRLKHKVGLISAVSLIAGTLIGSGIFMSPEGVLYHVGSPAGSLIIWAACGLLAMFGAMSYAELGTIIEESGGKYIYILRNFGSLPGFLFVYMSIIVVRPASVAGVSLSFAKYAVAPFYQGCSSPEVVVKCMAAFCILLLTIINCFSVRLASVIMNIFTAAKLLVLLVIVTGRVVLLINGHTQSFQDAFQNTTAGIGSIGVAFYQGLWSYDGWNNLNYVTEEFRKPEVNLPRAMTIAIPLVTCLYLLVNVSYFAALTPTELLSSGPVLGAIQDYQQCSSYQSLKERRCVYVHPSSITSHAGSCRLTTSDDKMSPSHPRLKMILLIVGLISGILFTSLLLSTSAREGEKYVRGLQKNKDDED